ncbi:hypothetical protein [Erwinia sp. S38]|uniref:hypothetical protein n=1 Tax=Erwinia sp. S38 TaxID=2769338 RepID=UPI00190C59B9|nr:hypothetical protein [Erwinia sp. S38]MBK0001427.1 hypothetical protein [Erwinia sp. S38]
MRDTPAIVKPQQSAALDYLKHDAATAARYADELQQLFNLHLDARLRQANPEAGARFWTLINELRLATGRTEMRIRSLEASQ